LEADLFRSTKARIKEEGLGAGWAVRRQVRSAMTVVRYADDFVVIRRDIVEKAKIIISDWLAEMGLELKPSKTKVSHTIENLDGKTGFNFFGCEIN
jgi:RNA-directed DNA polymerase